jgi:hypothetical protein
MGKQRKSSSTARTSRRTGLRSREIIRQAESQIDDDDTHDAQTPPQSLHHDHSPMQE